VGPRTGLDAVMKRKFASPYRDLNHPPPPNHSAHTAIMIRNEFFLIIISVYIEFLEVMKMKMFATKVKVKVNR
jgi:hypothetical protein